MEGSFLSNNWGCSSVSSVYGVCSIFSLYFLPPPFLMLKKKPKALRHTFSTIESLALCILSVLCLLPMLLSLCFLTQLEYALTRLTFWV